jgi:hypothetical protein
MRPFFLHLGAVGIAALQIASCRLWYDVLPSTLEGDHEGGRGLGGASGDAATGLGGIGASSTDAGTDGSGGATTAGTGTGGIPLNTRLVHRYTFDGTGTTVTDGVGTAHGTIVGGATLDGDGKVTLAGGTSDEYIELPNGIISSLSATTIETWVYWDGDEPWAWQRVFDFGNSDAGEGLQGISATTHLSLALESSFTRLVFDADPALQEQTWRHHFGGGLTGAEPYHIVAVFSDEPGDQHIICYVDGVPLAGATSVPDSEGLADLDDVNNWLGRAQWAADDDFAGIFYEVRIYDVALTQAEVVESGAAGPDTPIY